MSWSPDLFIGELRPWPDTVHVVRGKTDEMRRYVPEEMLFHERDGHDEQFERARSLQAENAKLREQIHWLKKGDILHVLTDQEFAEQQKHEREMQASIKALDDENAKLRELVRHLRECTRHNVCAACEYADVACDFDYDLRKLGIEVG